MAKAKKKIKGGKAVHGIESAQEKLHSAVEEAVKAFTEETGLTVGGIKWQTCNTVNSSNRTQDVGYWGFCSELHTGIS